MSLESVKRDYENELAMMQAWISRMDIEGNEENRLSLPYKQGWTLYLDAVKAIGYRMVNLCNEAEQNNSTQNLEDVLSAEADNYSEMAVEAANRGMKELEKMLKHESESRSAILQELAAG